MPTSTATEAATTLAHRLRELAHQADHHADRLRPATANPTDTYAHHACISAAALRMAARLWRTFAQDTETREPWLRDTLQVETYLSGARALARKHGFMTDSVKIHTAKLTQEIATWTEPAT